MRRVTLCAKYVGSLVAIVALQLLTLSGAAAVPEISGYLEGEFRWFPEEPAFTGQESQFVSFALEPELYWSGDEQGHSAQLKLFYRHDLHNEGSRTHGDIRELYYRYSDSDWQLDVGISKVYWGVIESVHVVDIVNQTDNLESINGEIKLGQPMIALSLEREWGALEMYMLPWFRERQFSSDVERFQFGATKNGPLVLWDSNSTRWESGQSEKHLDFALRWANYFGSLDVAVSYFSGTNRDPILLPNSDITHIAMGDPSISSVPLVSYYEQMQQVGLELQYLLGDWALKFEGVHKELDSGDYKSVAVGFEYTFYDLQPWSHDIGFLFERLWNDRSDVDLRLFGSDDGSASGEFSPVFLLPAEVLSPFSDDVFLGMRFALNDVDSTEFIAGVIVDRETNATLATVEGSSRIGDSMRMALNAYFFSNVPENSGFSSYGKDDVLELKLSWYF